VDKIIGEGQSSSPSVHFGNCLSTVPDSVHPQYRSYVSVGLLTCGGDYKSGGHGEEGGFGSRRRRGDLSQSLYLEMGIGEVVIT